MRLKCEDCNLEACDCGSPRTCSCGHTAYEIYKIQNGKDYVLQQNVLVERQKSEVQIYDEYTDLVNQTGKRCKFNGAGAWSQCIYCGQYKYYAGKDNYQCTKPD